MKPITLFFEFDPSGEWLWKPGRFKGWFKDGRFVRYWWLCFAVAWVRLDLHDYNRHIAAGRTGWGF